jgi:hypothetical protein
MIFDSRRLQRERSESFLQRIAIIEDAVTSENANYDCERKARRRKYDCHIPGCVWRNERQIV